MSAQDYVKSIDLSGTPRSPVSMDAATEATAVFDQAKDQSQVVGSSLLSFAPGVAADLREAISNCALLAQLVANKQISDPTKPLEWFAAYSTVLQNLGWVLQDNGFMDYSTSGTAVEVNEQIISVMTVALGAAPAALAIISATITALKTMQPGSSWLTIFSRESQKATIARFQIGLVDSDAKGPFVALCACLVEANSSITQVLFFKFKNAHAAFKASTARVSLNPSALTALSVSIRNKTYAYQADYVSSILDVATQTDLQPAATPVQPLR